MSGSSWEAQLTAAVTHMQQQAAQDKLRAQVLELQVAELAKKVEHLGVQLGTLKENTAETLREVLDVLADDAVPPGVRKAAIAALRRLQA